jgi:hypothetical protein
LFIVIIWVVGFGLLIAVLRLIWPLITWIAERVALAA